MTEMGVDATLLEAVLDGEKTVVGRLRTSKFVTLRAGDKISFREDDWQAGRLVRSIPDRATATVVSTRFFDTFNDMLNHIPVEQLLTTKKNKEEALENYQQFYTQAQEAEYGVVAIEFKLT